MHMILWFYITFGKHLVKSKYLHIDQITALKPGDVHGTQTLEGISLNNQEFLGRMYVNLRII